VLGAGSSLIGAITVGADSVVGANTVVTKDVPAGSVVTGVAGTARPRSGHEGVPTL
jgi:serine O-acetyltransferase